MAYFYLLIALFSGVAKGYCGKTVSRDMSNFKECIFINLMRMLFSALVGLLLAVFKTDISGFMMTQESFFVYLLAAISMSVFCVAWMYAYQNEAYMFLSIFTMLGTVITCLLDIIFYNADIGLKQWCGMAILLLAVYIMSIYNKDIKGKPTVKGLTILIIGSIGSSLADFSQKVYTREIGQRAEIFNFYMYAFSFVLLAIVYVSLKSKKSLNLMHSIYDKKHLLIYFLMAFFLYTNSVTKTMAATFLSSAQIYPVLQGANLILSAIMTHVLFKEKINVKGLAGIVIAFIGLMLIYI